MKTHQPDNLATLLFGTYRRQVLALLLLHPDESFHLREIARVTRTQPGTLRRELAQLTAAGVLVSERVGNLVRYRANPACPIYEELRSVLRKTAGAADILRDALAALGDKVAVAFIYGSVASGKERVSSDIDLMVIGEASFEEVATALHPCQAQLRREVNPNVYGPNEFKRKVRQADPFLVRVLSEPKVFVIGREDDLGKPGSHRKAETA